MVLGPDKRLGAANQLSQMTVVEKVSRYPSRSVLQGYVPQKVLVDAPTSSQSATPFLHMTTHFIAQRVGNSGTEHVMATVNKSLSTLDV